MRALAIVILVLGVVGAGLILLGAARSLQFEAFGHQIGITASVDARLALITLPLLIGGMVLWFLSEQRARAKRGSPEA